MPELSTFDRLAAEAGQALLPLREALASTDAFIGFLGELGWTVTAVPAPLSALGPKVDSLFDSLAGLLGEGGFNVGASAGDPDASADATPVDGAARVLAAVTGLISAIREEWEREN